MVDMAPILFLASQNQAPKLHVSFVAFPAGFFPSTGLVYSAVAVVDGAQLSQWSYVLHQSEGIVGGSAVASSLGRSVVAWQENISPSGLSPQLAYRGYDPVSNSFTLVTRRSDVTVNSGGYRQPFPLLGGYSNSRVNFATELVIPAFGNQESVYASAVLEISASNVLSTTMLTPYGALRGVPSVSFPKVLYFDRSLGDLPVRRVFARTIAH
jgi:hypothetical protein